jgi:putative hydrolase of the HAD superfamily
MASWVDAGLSPDTIDLLAFDLDNTLYDEGQYFAGAFRTIAPRLAAKSGVEAPAIERRLAAILEAKGRHYHRLFNDVMAEIGLDPASELAWVLELYRTADAPLEPFPGTRELLRDLGRHYRLGMITSGMRPAQENKIRRLDIARHFEAIVFSSTLPENKPGRLPFQSLLDTLGVVPGRAVYVGDNPHFDFRGANELGMLTIRVHSREFEGLEVAPECDGRMKIGSVTELRRLFLKTEGSDRRA